MLSRGLTNLPTIVICDKDNTCNVKLPWTSVLDLVRSRTVILNNGTAHIPCTYILQASLDHFCDELCKGLDSARAAYGTGKNWLEF